MRAEDLKEAQGHVDSIKAIDAQLRYTLANGAQQLVVEHAPRSTTYLHISRAVAEAALAMQKEEMRKRRAALVRRLNQLGVVL